MDCQQKTEKSIIVNLCGVKYKAKHQNSTSINSRFLLFLGQIKYFIKIVIKKAVYCLRKIIVPIFQHVFDNYEEPVIYACSVCIVLGMFSIVIIPILDLILPIKGTSPHAATHDPNASISSIILNHILTYSLMTLASIIGIILGTYCLSHLAMAIKQITIFIYKIISIILSFTTNIINRYYLKIPDVEPVDPLDIV